MCVHSTFHENSAFLHDTELHFERISSSWVNLSCCELMTVSNSYCVSISIVDSLDFKVEKGKREKNDFQ